MYEKKANNYYSYTSNNFLFFIFQVSNKKPPSIYTDESTTHLSIAPTDSPTPTSSVEPTTFDVKTFSPDAGIDKALTKITQALQTSNAIQIQTLLTNDVILGNQSGNTTDGSGSRDKVVQWLNEHWGTNRQYVSKNYVPHFGYWEIETNGWSGVASGKVFFRLFCYDGQGQRQTFDGDWKIYAVLY